MTQDAEVCPHCGEPVTGGSYYCGACGKAVAPSERPMPGRKFTMLGVMPDAVPQPPVESTPPAVEAAHEERTTDVGISQPAPGAMGRTMLGMPPAPRRQEPPASSAVQDKAFAKTMLGMPLGVAGPTPARTPTPSPAAAQVEMAGLGARTLLGVAGAPAGAPSPSAPVPQTQEPAAEAEVPVLRKQQDSARTMLGLDEHAAPVETEKRASRPSGSTGTGRGSRPSGAGVRKGPAPAAVALAAVAMIAAGVLGYLALRGRGPEVRVRVVTDADGESMLFEVPGAPAGAKLRFGGQEKPVAAGRASFSLAPDSLRVGKNAVLFDVVRPGGAIESGRVALSVDYRVTLDTAPLRAGKPAIDVVVAAVPGSKVWLDGAPLALDAQGRAVRSDPLELAAASGRAEHVVKYRVQPPAGEASVGEVRASIPVTMMQIDRPGAVLVTDRKAVEIAGAVDKDARVTIDDQSVEVHSGRFLYRYELPHVGDYGPQVVAISEGKAPRAVTLSVQRVEDLAKAAEGFEPDRSLTYAKIVQNPAIYRGQRVELEGRVYNVNVEGGKSALQVLVRACPRGERCPLWVSYPSATELTVNSWVRVLGVVEGEQQFRSETEEVKSVPKVEAAFLLPAKP
jgi:hypothetical protein